MQIEEACNAPLETIFASFDEKPIAAASIAQVHKAQLHNGDWVAVKLLRPHIRDRMRKDTDFFMVMARLAETLSPALSRLHLRGSAPV